jgi:hypothetical protein
MKLSSLFLFSPFLSTCPRSIANNGLEKLTGGGGVNASLSRFYPKSNQTDTCLSTRKIAIIYSRTRSARTGHSPFCTLKNERRKTTFLH